MIGVFVLVAFDMPKCNVEGVTESDDFTNCLVYITIVGCCIVWPPYSGGKQCCDICDDSLVVAETLKLGAIILGGAVT